MTNWKEHQKKYSNKGKKQGVLFHIKPKKKYFSLYLVFSEKS